MKENMKEKRKKKRKKEKKKEKEPFEVSVMHHIRALNGRTN
jgi:hypothetical protein